LRQRLSRELEETIVAPYYSDNELARIVLTGKQLARKRIGLGIYLVEIKDNHRSIRFIRELREVENPNRIYVIIPKELSDAFKDRQRVNVTLTKLNRDDFFTMVKDSLIKLYGLDRLEVKDGKLLMQIEGKELEFTVSNYGYQKQYGYTGAYLTFEGPLPANQPFKILFDGYGEPSFLIFEDVNRYRTIQGISYNIEFLHLNIAYKHDEAREHTKTIRIGETFNAEELKQHFKRYFQAKSKGVSSEMGAAGTAIAAILLKDMGYKVIWADTVTGTTEGPDISLFDDYGNKITAEAKSTSNSEALNHILHKAIFDIETFYFDHTNPRRKFLRHTENETIEYEADYALAIAIYLDRSSETVDMKMRVIKALVNEGGVKFERTPLTWRKEHG